MKAFKTFLLHLPENDIRDLFLDVVNQISPKNPDLPMIRQNIDSHIEAVFAGLHPMKSAL
jgi:hypothetical protein